MNKWRHSKTGLYPKPIHNPDEISVSLLLEYKYMDSLHSKDPHEPQIPSYAAKLQKKQRTTKKTRKILLPTKKYIIFAR
jgi:hypothetical protein